MKGTGSILFVCSVIFVVINYGNAGIQSGLRSYYTRNSSMKSSRSNINVQPAANLMDDNKTGTVNETKNAGARGSSLSAWGIISIVLAVIILVTSGYYAFVFYPFLCRKERNYDMIELTNVI